MVETQVDEGLVEEDTQAPLPPLRDTARPRIMRPSPAGTRLCRSPRNAPLARRCPPPPRTCTPSGCMFFFEPQ